MPGYNQTGPLGSGPRTGRGMGFCNPSSDVYSNFGPGAGMGMRRGLRRGPGLADFGFRGRRFARRQQNIEGYPPDERNGAFEMLKAQAKSMQNALDAINKRMEALEAAND